ncbi:MAG: heparinase II/III family protein [Planctomycetes bacterium]|nr:heparinase II/III family protein [Planctomycetota bacterium]
MTISIKSDGQLSLLGHKTKRYVPAQWLALWSSLANNALMFRLEGERKYLDVSRRKMMSLCSWPYWGDPNSEEVNLSLESVLPLIQLCLAYDWLKKDLVDVEQKRVKEKLLEFAQLYLKVKSGRKESSWYPIMNHPHFSLHMSAVYLLGRVLSHEQSGHICSLWAKKELRRALSTLSNIKDGSIHLGPCEGRLTDLGYMIFLLAEKSYGSDLDDELKSPWLQKRAEWFDAMLLPGAKNVVPIGSASPRSPFVSLASLLHMHGALFPNAETRNLAEQVRSEERDVTYPWDFLTLLYGKSLEAVRWPRQMNVSYFPDWGVVSAKKGSTINEAYLSYKAGSPGSKYLYHTWRNGNKYLSFEADHPDQGSFSWYVKGRSILSDSGRTRIKQTHHHNTLLVDGMGQITEGYPSFSLQELKVNNCNSTVTAIRRRGDSLLIRSQIKPAYSEDARLVRFERCLMWLSSDMLIVIDHIKCETTSALELFFRSANYPLVKHSHGFYQKVSGMSMVSKGSPQGEWRTGFDQHDTLGGRNYFAALKCHAKEWWNVSIMAPSGEVSDLKLVEHKSQGIEFSFSDGQISIEYQMAMDGKWMSCKRYGLPFWEIGGDKRYEGIDLIK